MRYAVFALAMAVCGCASTPRQPASVAPAPAGISEIRAEPKTMHLDHGDHLTLSYRLAAAANVTVAILDDWDRQIRHLDAGSQPAGPASTVWDGLGTDAQPVPNGVYRYVITATSLRSTSVYAPLNAREGDEVLARRFTYDQATGHMQFIIPRLSRARVRIGLKDFPHLRTLMDWEPLEAGEHTLEWDGMDADGLIRLRQHPKLDINLSAFALPENAVIVRGSSREAVPPEAPPVSRTPTTAYLHARHDRGICHEPRFAVELPQAVTGINGHPVVHGKTPVRIMIDPRDKAHVVNQRFEVMFYVDTVFLFEEEEGSSPFTFEWNTSALTPGPHLLTVNVLSYDDHVGVVTVPVEVASGPS